MQAAGEEKTLVVLCSPGQHMLQCQPIKKDVPMGTIVPGLLWDN